MKLNANDGYTSATKQESCQVKRNATSFLLLLCQDRTKVPVFNDTGTLLKRLNCVDNRIIFGLPFSLHKFTYSWYTMIKSCGLGGAL